MAWSRLIRVVVCATPMPFSSRKKVLAAARIRKHRERITVRSKHADPGTAAVRLILKILEHPTRLWRLYHAPFYTESVTHQGNANVMENDLGQVARRRANVSLEGIEDWVGAHLQAANERCAA